MTLDELLDNVGSVSPEEYRMRYREYIADRLRADGWLVIPPYNWEERFTNAKPQTLRDDS